MHKILVVDDEESIHMVYREEFEDDGYTVIHALNGEEGLEKFSDETPDLVILDILMPGMNGIEVLRLMKMMNTSVPIILHSAYAEYIREEVGIVAPDAYVVKSGCLDDLKREVRSQLGTSSEDSRTKHEKIEDYLIEGIKKFLNDDSGDVFLSTKHSKYIQLVSYFRQKGYTQGDVDTTFEKLKLDFSREISRVRKLLRNKASESGTIDLTESEKLYKKGCPWSIVELARFKRETDKLNQKIVVDSELLKKRMKKAITSIVSKKYQDVPLQSLQRAFQIKTAAIPVDKELSNLVMTDIRHDLKNALSSMFIYLERLTKDINTFEKEMSFFKVTAKNNDERQSSPTSSKRDRCNDSLKVLEKLNETHSKLIKIYERLYDISFLRVEPYFEIIAVREFIEKIANEAGLFGASHIKSTIECDDFQINTEPTLLGAALRQVIQNAIEAIGENGSIRISARFSFENKKIEFVVEDNGHGIPKYLLGDVFTPNRSYNKTGNSGLGLSIARLALSEIGGEIMLDSEVGVGTSVRISTPWEM